MLGKPDNGTRIDSVRLGAAISSIPPERTCDSISGSPPSWLLENTVMLSRPPDCVAVALAASTSLIVRGWLSGVLTPNLNSNSAAARAGRPSIEVAQAAEAVPRTALRVNFIGSSLPDVLRPVTTEPPCVASRPRPDGPHDETASRGRRNHFGEPTKQSGNTSRG